VSRPLAIPVDQAQRDSAIAERRRNVLIEAGAGTGKTTTIVRRIVQLIAPDGKGQPMPLRRIAAITFTRRAAGELSLRVREELFRRLSDPDATPKRRALWRQALAEIDTAWIGTIHSFADRLLRLRPVEARQSPRYEIVEDEAEEEALVAETFELLMWGAEHGTLADYLYGSEIEGKAAEAEQTLADALRAGLRTETHKDEHYSVFGLDALVGGLIRHRDVPPQLTPVSAPDLKATHRCMREFMKLAERVTEDSDFGTTVCRIARKMSACMQVNDPVRLYAEVVLPIHQQCRRDLRKGGSCNGDEVTWRVWKALKEGGKHRLHGEAPLEEDLCSELARWLGRRLVRLGPVVLALYEQVKMRHGVLDQIDLLLKLRGLLRDNTDVRGFYQAMFDHILVDEFQDTDPLQAEIVQYLCEATPLAETAEDVELQAGKLTIAGDPKQSIYRFRRADVMVYDRVTRKLADTALQVELSANFRSVPALIGWYNTRFPGLLGEDEAGTAFASTTGQVYHRGLATGRQEDRTPTVHVLPVELQEPRRDAPAYRAAEAEALSRYLRWLVEKSGEEVYENGTRRPVQYGDICVLALATTNLSLMFKEMDRMDVPYSAGGGKLFLTDHLQQQFILGLRALAEPDDGVAQAALLRPPFFATDLRDLFESRAVDATGKGPDRVRQARALIADLRRQRFSRPPGVTARGLLEATGLGRAIALAPNGRQRLQLLREICHLLEAKAAALCLDYDGVTALLRTWIREPARLDAPRPVADDAVQVMSVHQAKGLEFPAVVLWDGRAELNTRASRVAFQTAHDGRSWVMALDGLNVAEPAGNGLSQRAKEYENHERRRLVYVAATRARDLLVVPETGKVTKSLISSVLVGIGASANVSGSTVRRLSTYTESIGADWSRKLTERAMPEPKSVKGLECEVVAKWKARSALAGAPRSRPIGVAQHAHAGDAATAGQTGDETPVLRPTTDQAGRYGRLFGTVVHKALKTCIEAVESDVREAVAIAAGQVGLAEHLDEAVDDVGRGLTALKTAGLLSRAGAELRLEYPVSGPNQDGTVLLGYADMVAHCDEKLTIVDFKTDAPPNGPVAMVLPGYVEQVRSYGALLAQSLAEMEVRSCLLFTANGEIHWT
jgi:ATP-dependent helicase/nuclease subunit A